MKNFKVGQRWHGKSAEYMVEITHVYKFENEITVYGRGFHKERGIYRYLLEFNEEGKCVVRHEIYGDIENFGLISRIPDIEYCQEGDILQDENSFIKIIGRAGNVFFVTHWAISVYDISDSDTRSISLDELKAWKVKLYLPEEPATSITLSKQQIAEKFGCDVSQLQIED